MYTVLVQLILKKRVEREGELCVLLGIWLKNSIV